MPHTGGLAADGYAPPGMTPDYGAAPPGYAGTTRLSSIYLFIYLFLQLLIFFSFFFPRDGRYPPIQTFQPVVLLVEVLPSGPTTILRITEGALRRRGATMYSALLSPLHVIAMGL